ncbi:MAG: 2-amino-4-hydroxy-6-hydroxymethyldihydropteridine diphosphokinase [Desulfarculaceae bacterium]|nr:2-amino-4-hydroxy-6-hydroxymethyldihydropteridine diphosphokinase [Desulfarculaceae bacterium]MCF8073467.1 2-amino-4-hydroxy-6-hydroxymethyldihydropteridine diphosphokinase [Desulfarculaceae bacterium]MCF8100386.1 2-amino-4-hydroxy-6-hydroxymethyldihydropteridine diphosphokinase [Desulfarculaceae bacterium]MCF8115878.1 2-amino-4-hydroxy-6-hydroxymethyldihydropteridine diphosphokinase [Desulfarculaceae bacterium]
MGLGCNQGDCQEHLHAALEGLAALAGYATLALSSLYLTAPVGKTDQARFYNAVVRGRYSGEPGELLAGLQAVEKARGRVRLEQWGPRTLDLDLLIFGELVVDLPELTVPHPRLAERGFVLIPLAELAPELIIPGLGLTPGQLWERLPAQERARQELRQIEWD